MGSNRHQVLILGVLCLSLAILAEDCVFPGVMKATYYGNINLQEPDMFTRFEYPNYTSSINPFFPGGPTQMYSIRYEATLTFPTTGNYNFIPISDDGIRLYIDGVLICQNWGVHSMQLYNCKLSMPFNAGDKVQFTVEYFQYFTNQGLFLNWITPGASAYTPIPPANLYYTNCTVYQILGVRTTLLDFNAGQAQLKYSLSGQPTSDVHLTIATTCSFLNLCALTFTSANFDVNQFFTAFADPTWSGCCNVTATADSNDPNYNGQVFVTRMCPGSSANKTTGVSWGDPHFTTFDGQHYTFLGVGDYYITRQTNGEFAVQARQMPCSTASCNAAVAVKFRNSVYFVWIGIDTGTPGSQVFGNTLQDGMTVTTSGGIYTVTTAYGAQVTITPGFWSTRQVYFLDVQVVVPNFYKGQLVGLLGFFDGDLSNDYTFPNGSTVANAFVANFDSFTGAWAVPDNENLFNNPAASLGLLLNALPPVSGAVTKCGVTPTSAPTNQPSLPPVPPKPSVIPTPGNCFVFSDPNVEAAAIAACSPYFNDSCCNRAGVDGDSYYQTCLCDYNTAGADLVSSNIAAYNQQCATQVASRGINCKTCPNGCNGHGTCNTNNGACTCTPPWKGSDCSQNSSSCTITTEISPSHGGRMCTNTLTISGQNFFATTLYCVFGGTITVPATRINNFQATCVVPKDLLTSVSVAIYANGTCWKTTATYTLDPFCCDGPAGTALTFGDPHIDTFDGTQYTFLDVGTYYFVRQSSGDFAIQVQQVPCGPTASCNGAAAIKFMNLVIFAVLEGNGSSLFIGSTAPIADYQVSMSKISDTRYQFIFPTGAKVLVLTLPWAALNLYFLNVQVILPASYVNSVFGLGGTFDHDKTNDFLKADGSVLGGDPASILSFARSWKVPANENLFNNASAKIPRIFGGGSPLTQVPSPCSPVPTSPPIPTVINPPNNKTIPDRNGSDCDTLKSSNPTVLAAAEEECGRYFNDSCCSLAGVNGTAYREICICDYMAASGDSLLPASVQAYADACAVAGGNNCAPPTNPPISTPPAPQCMDVVEISPASGGLYCGGTITVIGGNFSLAETIFCSFDGNMVPATKVNDTMATCSIPILLLNDASVTIVAAGVCSRTQAIFRLTSDCCQTGSSTAITWGDPHINTIDGNFYTTYNTPGSFYFARQSSGDFVIQTTHVTCGLALCNTAAAIKFVDVVIFVSFDSLGNAVFSIHGDAAAAGITHINYAGDRYTITLPTGIEIKTDVVYWPTENSYYLNLKLTVPDYYQNQLAGLMGYFDGNAANDLMSPTGTVYTASSASSTLFVLSWAVPTAENLFTNPDAVIPPIHNGGSAAIVAPIPCGPVATSPPPSGPPTSCPAMEDDDGTWPRGALGAVVRGTCAIGYVGYPTRQCNADGTWGPLLTACDPGANSCPAETYAHAYWPGADWGTSATGVCEPGWSNNANGNAPVRQCIFPDLTWSTSVQNLCKRNKCPATTEQNANWIQTDSLQTATGICKPGYTGSPTRWCGADGTFGPISNPCSPVQCGLDFYGHATWNPTLGATTATGVCDNGYAGSPTRYCDNQGNWSTSLLGRCSVATCPMTSETGVDWPQANAFETKTGVCKPGYTGSPTKTCLGNGSWDVTVNPCASAHCDLETYGHVDWPQTPYQTWASGTCSIGYFGNPSRFCGANGWSTSIFQPCEKTKCPTATFGFITFPETPSGQTAKGACAPGTTGTPILYCKPDATWDPSKIRGSCQ